MKLGDTYSELKRPAEALDFFERALEIRRELGDRWGEGETLHKQGLVLNDSGQPEQATRVACARRWPSSTSSATRAPPT